MSPGEILMHLSDWAFAHCRLVAAQFRVWLLRRRLARAIVHMARCRADEARTKRLLEAAERLP
jgi:hypothetical protein